MSGRFGMILQPVIELSSIFSIAWVKAESRHNPDHALNVFVRSSVESHDADASISREKPNASLF